MALIYEEFPQIMKPLEILLWPVVYTLFAYSNRAPPRVPRKMELFQYYEHQAFGSESLGSVPDIKKGSCQLPRYFLRSSLRHHPVFFSLPVALFIHILELKSKVKRTPNREV